MRDFEELARVLRCPVCQARVRIRERRVFCTNPECRRSYPIDELDIAHMVAEEATIEKDVFEE